MDGKFTPNSPCRWEMREALTVLTQDAALRPLLDRFGSIELRARRPYFWSLCRAILAQQVSGASARAVTARVRALFPDRRYPDPRSVLLLRPESFRAAGVSRQKSRYLHALAEAFAEGQLAGARFSRLSDEQIIERLTAVKGVGRWTAEMFLIFSMRRPDVFPVDDLGIRRGMSRLFKLREIPVMMSRADRWRPYRTAASLYLWRAAAAPPE